MNNNVNTMSFRIGGDLAMASAVSVVSASQGILADQGIHLSSGSDLGLQGFATKAQAMKTIVDQDKPEAGWQHPGAAYVATGVIADETGESPANLRAARRRNTHPANVIRSRHRSRLG
ncbi:hypothetical protein [Nocardia sp. NPDC057668]|uniref:hypothetical protein n=1 Tax=Nocardia sp. NPDC057668 TaxID=3346202 RepID=UPI003672BA84